MRFLHINFNIKIDTIFTADISTPLELDTILHTNFNIKWHHCSTCIIARQTYGTGKRRTPALLEGRKMTHDGLPEAELRLLLTLYTGTVR